jgi:hypothetical protein
MIKDLAKLASRLDQLGLTKEADVLDSAMRKLAQVATTGVAGATYSGGMQITPGRQGGTVAKFYKAKPKSLAEFNKFLSALIVDVSRDRLQRVFSRTTISNAASLASQTTWSPMTGSAFKEYATAVGYPAAGDSWEPFAKSNNYEPTMFGIFAFWSNTIAKAMDVGRVAVERLTDLGQKEEGEIPTYEPEAPKGAPLRTGPSVKYPGGGGPNTDLGELDEYLDKMEKAKQKPAGASGTTSSPGTLKGRVYDVLTGGSGFHSSDVTFFDTYTKKIMREIAAAQTPEAKAWFAQDPRKVIPDEFKGYSELTDLEMKAWAAKNGDAKVFNQETEQIYMRIADIAAEAERTRKRSRKESRQRHLEGSTDRLLGKDFM